MPAQSRLTFKISVVCPTADVNKKPSPNSSAAKREAQHFNNSVLIALPAKTANPFCLRTSYTASTDRRQKTKMIALFAPNPESYESQESKFRKTPPPLRNLGEPNCYRSAGSFPEIAFIRKATSKAPKCSLGILGHLPWQLFFNDADV